jgi:hypothetical protein
MTQETTHTPRRVFRDCRAGRPARRVRRPQAGAPGREEFAVSAMAAAGGRVVVNDDAVRGLQITPEQLREVAERHYPLRRPAWLALT